jgi:hypothetical protein
VDPGLRLELEAAGWGWLDRSGHLRLVRGGLQIDRRLSNLIGPDTAPIDPLARPTGLAVAVCLLEGSGTDSVRGLATAAGVSTGAAHSALTELATLGLLEEGQRRDPDLFWAVAARWSTRWYALRNGPGPDIPVKTRYASSLRVSGRRSWREVPGAPHNHAGVSQLDEGSIVEQVDLVEWPWSSVGGFVLAGLVEQ